MELSSDTKFCPYCEETIRKDALRCRYCKEILDNDIRALRVEDQRVRKWSPGVAGFLSFLFPGVGQVYKGRVGPGVLWLVCISLAYAMTWIAGLLVYIACIYDAAVSEADPFE
jgi:TM2 domain-containing membrane protein YozV